MHACRPIVESTLTDVFEKSYRQNRLHAKFDVSTHTHAIFKTTCNELRLTTILFQLPIHSSSRTK